MAISEKIKGIRERLFGALDDVPDNLIGTIVALTVLTLIVLGSLMFLGYKVTNP